MKIKNFKQLIEASIIKKSNKIAVVAGENLGILQVIAKAEEIGLSEFIIIGDESEIRSIINSNSLVIKAQVVNEPDHKKAADMAVDLVVEGEAGTLMKGMLHSSVFLKAILNKEKGLNTGKHITQISVMEKDNDDGFLFITDCAIIVSPDLLGKKEVLENAVDLTHKLMATEQMPIFHF